MTVKSKPLFVYDMREPVWKSWARDTYSLGVLVGMAWFVNTAIPPSGWFNFLVVALWLIWLFGKSQSHRIKMTATEAREWLDENYPITHPNKESAEDRRRDQ